MNLVRRDFIGLKLCAGIMCCTKKLAYTKKIIKPIIRFTQFEKYAKMIEEVRRWSLEVD